MIEPTVYANTGIPEEWEVIAASFPTDQVERQQSSVDECLNIEGQQLVVPDGMIHDEKGDCIVEPQTVSPAIRITELLPNPLGSDVGNEFIELYNPEDLSVDLSGYRIVIGIDKKTSVTIPASTLIASKEYLVLRNDSLSFTLPNTTTQVSLYDPNGILLYSIVPYVYPPEGSAWALHEDVWQYTTQPSPGVRNSISLIPVEDTVILSIQKECAANQYRSPETNRCRLIETNVAAKTPCKDTQYRSEETGRCRAIAAASEPTPCKEGQERNPDTNRCRTIKTMSAVDYAVLGATKTSSPDQWYIIAAIIGIVVLLASYAVWEFRDVVKRPFVKAWQFVRSRR